MKSGDERRIEKKRLKRERRNAWNNEIQWRHSTNYSIGLPCWLKCDKLLSRERRGIYQWRWEGWKKRRRRCTSTEDFLPTDRWTPEKLKDPWLPVYIEMLTMWWGRVQYLRIRSARVNGIVMEQRRRSEKASIMMKMLRAVIRTFNRRTWNF